MTIDEQQLRTAGPVSLAVKVPQITAMFWVIKVLTTGMGETASDFFAKTIDPPVAVGITGLALAAALIVQLRSRRYRTGVYWFAVVMVSVFGTMAADVLHVGLGIPYPVSTVAFSLALVVVLVTWYLSERTLSIHTVTHGRPELFYWATVLVTFALGTAGGDLTATTLRWGYLPSGLVFAAALIVALVGYLGSRRGPAVQAAA
ncbi:MULTISPECIES: hypothetical protein [unclassified Actinoplanes]|uniref:COG4705 family protein n=1 Tax=unclassified Actinoplanes TaxID=2626549 RepID=UPI0018D3C47D|nr:MULTISPECIES: hypothetical protein [unclassified Actinoplanes]